MCGTYVVGDIHGCFDEWISLKNKIEAQDPEATFILVGDIVDRGPKTMEMIRWAMENITSDGKYQMILGNHEYEKINWWDAYQDAKEDACTIDYRDYDTDNYDFSEVMAKKHLTDEEVQRVIEFFRSLPLYKDIYVESELKDRGKEHFVIVHSYYPYNCRNKNETFRKNSVKLPKKFDCIRSYTIRKNIDSVLWNRNYFGYGDLKKTTVVHGHSPTILGELLNTQKWVKPGTIAVAKHDINVDCGCVFKSYKESNLGAVRLEDLETYYLYEREDLNEWEE